MRTTTQHPKDCHQIVTKIGARQEKMEQMQKTEMVAISRLTKGIS
jgi:hypothetical protein